MLGYEEFDPYATPDSAGDPEKAKQMLADAGFPNGLDLTFLYRKKGKAPDIATTLQADLAKADIRLDLKPVPPADFYTKFLSEPVAPPSRGEWDMAAPGWIPDWYGNAARSFFVPLLDGRLYGRGHDQLRPLQQHQVNALIDQALAAPDEATAKDLWHQADELTMADAPWVPITTGKTRTTTATGCRTSSSCRWATPVTTPTSGSSSSRQLDAPRRRAPTGGARSPPGSGRRRRRRARPPPAVSAMRRLTSP